MRKGFTLIELLAVIVILSLVALIATPIILHIIEVANGKARIGSANGILNASKYFYTESLLDPSIVYPAEGIEFICNGKSCQAMIGNLVEEEGIMVLAEEASEPIIYTLNLNGTIPSSGSIFIFNNGNIEPVNLAIHSHLCTYDSDQKIFTDC